MFARRLYAQIYLHKNLIIHWCISECEYDEKYFKKLVGRNLNNSELTLITKCFPIEDFPDIPEEDFYGRIISELAPCWINQWEYNQDFCFIKAQNKREVLESTSKDVLEYIDFLKEKRRRK